MLTDEEIAALRKAYRKDRMWLKDNHYGRGDKGDPVAIVARERGVCFGRMAEGCWYIAYGATVDALELVDDVEEDEDRDYAWEVNNLIDRVLDDIRQYCGLENYYEYTNSDTAKRNATLIKALGLDKVEDWAEFEMELLR